jgi:bacillithiol system protein YtxJ
MGIFDKLFKRKQEAEIHQSDTLEWFNLASIQDLDAALEVSNSQPIMLFKHSTRCSISASALDRLARNWKGKEVNIRPFYLDLLNHRDVSNQIAERLQVEHQSPQMIVVSNENVIFYASHSEITFDDVKKHAPRV